MNASMIRPGLLVALKSTLNGGVSYSRTDLAAGERDDGSSVARWETTRTIDDPAEYKRAQEARQEAVATIRKICSQTTFGLLCPESLERELDDSIARARAIVRAHNETAKCTQISIYALKGRIASSDAEAARAIGQEVASLIDGMNGAIDRLDAAAIREAANKARQMSSMLSPETSAKVGEAIEAARKAARAIVKRVEKGGEEAAAVLKDIQRGAIEGARIAFLDLDCAEPPPAVDAAMPAVNVQRFDLDLDESPPVAVPQQLAVPLFEIRDGDEVRTYDMTPVPAVDAARAFALAEEV